MKISELLSSLGLNPNDEFKPIQNLSPDGQQVTSPAGNSEPEPEPEPTQQPEMVSKSELDAVKAQLAQVQATNASLLARVNTSGTGVQVSPQQALYNLCAGKYVKED